MKHACSALHYAVQCRGLCYTCSIIFIVCLNVLKCVTVRNVVYWMYIGFVVQQTALFKFAKLCIVRHNEPNRTVECKILAICNNALYCMCVVLMVQCNVLSLLLFSKAVYCWRMCAFSDAIRCAYVYYRYSIARY